MAKMSNTILPIEQEYDRHIDPLPTEEEELPPLEALSDNMVENDDGSVTILDEVDDSAEDTEFLVNLAETLDERVLNEIATDLIDLVEKDKEARSRRDEQYAEGIKRTGLGQEAPGGASFDGASSAVHPVLAEGCIDFAARAMKELFPAHGPVKTQVIGEQTDEKLEKAGRKKQYMNWQLTTQIKEYRSELEQLLTQLPLGGSQYLKVWYDARVERPRVEFVPIDDMYLPFAASSFQMAHRVTHSQLITRNAFEGRIASGMYRDLALADATLFTGQTGSSKASDKIEGKADEMCYNEDGLRQIYEIYVDYRIEDDTEADDSAPYIITVDQTTSKVLSIYRNWDEEDEKQEKQDWVVDFGFIAWRGAYAIGLPHLIGSLSGALTGALRAILDSAHVNNTPSGLKLKGSRMSGQNIQPEIGQIAEIEGPAGVTDIRQLVMPMPFNPPSPVLFQLLDWLVGQAKGVVATAEESIASASNNMPVGTALALIEQGSQVFSAIHSRLHASQARVLRIIHRLNGIYLDDEETVEELGELIVSRTDFQGAMDVVPVSDPNVFSEAQRYAQLQAVLQLADKYPQLYRVDKLNERALKLINFPGSEEVLNVNNEPEKLDPITENTLAASGEQPLKAYEDQDHIAHLGCHVAFLSSPLFCLNPLMASPALPALLKHCKEHLVMQYAKHAKAAVMAGMEIDGNNSADHAISMADKALATQLGPIMEHLGQAMQQQSKLIQPPPPADPNAAVNLQIGMAEIARKGAVDKAEQARTQIKDQADAQKITLEGQIKQASDNQAQQFEIMQQKMEDVRLQNEARLNTVSELLRNESDNHTKVLVADINATKQAIDDSSSQFQMQIQQLIDQLSAPPEQPGMLQRLRQMFGGQQVPPQQ